VLAAPVLERLIQRRQLLVGAAVLEHRGTGGGDLADGHGALALHACTGDREADLHVERVVDDPEVEDQRVPGARHALALDTPAGTSHVAEWATVKNGRIAEIRVFFDARPSRRCSSNNDTAPETASAERCHRSRSDRGRTPITSTSSA
jgi:hypothetical protein